MNSKTKKIIGLMLLLLFIIIAIILAIWLPDSSRMSNLNFIIEDRNQNYHYEVGEELTMTVSDSTALEGRDFVWQFGNGDTIQNKNIAKYTYRKKGDYLVTLNADDRFKTSRYIKVISSPEKKAIDSVTTIYGPDQGYVNEELVFSSYTPGVDSWYWEFGESGTVDAYEGQVVYIYKTPGVYRVQLKTNITRYPIYHTIEIIPLFEALEVEKPADSLGMAALDIKKRFQAIADANHTNRKAYYKNLNYIKKKYTCKQADEVVVLVNGVKYNDLYSYCQGLHILEGKRKKTLKINEVKVDTFHCLKKIEVNQSIIK